MVKRHTAKKDFETWLGIYGPALLMVALALVVAYQFIAPAPPKRLVMATGAAGNAYYAFGLRYKALLEREGIVIEVRETAGSVENLDLLGAEQADLAFVQGGVSTSTQQPGLTSLASVYFEPLWLFHRQIGTLDRLPALRGLSVGVGPVGSGTRALVDLLLNDNAIGQADADLRPLTVDESAQALVAGSMDAMFVVASPVAPIVQELVSEPGVELSSMQRAHAYVRRYGFLTTLELPEGTLDLTRNLPPRDVRLLAAAANLVAAPGLHPAIVGLLLQAAHEIHGNAGLFQDADEFPSRDYLQFPLNADAEHYFNHGPPLLQRYLPFWTASLVDRLKVMLLPLVVLLIPMIKVLPPVYRWRMRARVYRWYRALQRIDDRLGLTPDSKQIRKGLDELDRLEADVQRVDVPLSFTKDLYHLRQHIDLVRARLKG